MASNVLFYDRSGSPVLSPASRSIAGNPSAVMPIGNYCADNNSFIVPDSFTMTAVNSGLVADSWKHSSFDNVVEAIRGSIGNNWFTIDELPNGNGTIAQEDGTNIYADDTLRRFTGTFAVAISEIVATGSAVANITEQLLNVYKGSLTRVEESTIKLVLDETNASSTPVLRFKGLWYLTSNKAFSVSVPAGTTMKLRFAVAGFKPYTEIF